MVNGRALAGITWVWESVGRSAQWGQLDHGPSSAPLSGADAEAVAAEALSWAVTYAASPPWEIGSLTADAPGMAERPRLREHVERMQPELDRWRAAVWPEPSEFTEPTAQTHIRWLVRRRSFRQPSETYLIVPVRRMGGARIGPSTYVVSRDLVITESVFEAWARRRRRMPILMADAWLIP